MSKGDFQRGKRDRQGGAPYNVPHQKGIFGSNTKQEIKNREDYRQGWRSGKR